jgi:hypothetical protein
MSFSVQKVTCNCGKVELEARGTPIVATVCHCSGCKEAGRTLERLPDAPRILDARNGTPFVLYRKDRVDCINGCELLRYHKLSASTPTRRVIATCCNSFMFLDFTRGHWTTLVRDRIGDGQADTDAPEQQRQSAFFFARLMMAWAKMGFRTPTIDYVQGELDNA